MVYGSCWPIGSQISRPVGLGDPIADAQATLRGGGQVNVNTLLAATQLTPDVVQGQVNQVVTQLSTDANALAANAQAKWQQATSDQANAQRVAQGTSAATDLISNGYNPDSAADNQKLILTIAGAASLIPAVGPFIGGALVLLDTIAQAVGKILEDVGLIWYGCHTSGGWTPRNVLDGIAAQAGQVTVNGNPQGMPSTPPGSFGALVLPMLVANATKLANCQGGLRSSQILAAAASMWNAGATGPPMSVFVPALDDSGSSNIFVDPYQIPYAFQTASDLSQIPSSPFGSSGYVLNVGTPPFILQLSGSAYAPTVAPTASTTAKKAAVVAAAAPATIAVSTLLYAWATGRSVDAVMQGLWRATKSFFGRVAGETSLRENPLSLLERQSTHVQSLLFPRSRFDASSARSWARQHGYRATKTHTTGDYVRVRQRPPGDFKRNSFRTIPFGHSGIKAVIGHLR